MRAMKLGDLAFFYASGGKVPAIVGIMEIVKEHEPDQTAWDESAYGYVENEKQRSKWCVVHVEFRKKFNKPITRAELMKHKLPGGALEQMQEFTAARLSVSKVAEDEWDFINSLLDEDDQYVLDKEDVQTAYVMLPSADGSSDEFGASRAGATTSGQVSVESPKANGIKAKEAIGEEGVDGDKSVVPSSGEE